MDENKNGFVEKVKERKYEIAAGLASVAGMFVTYQLGKLNIRKNYVVFKHTDKTSMEYYKRFFAGKQRLLSGGVIAKGVNKDEVQQCVKDVLNSGSDCTYGLILEKHPK